MNLYTATLQFIISGLTMGSIYALIGVGFVIIYNATGIPNLMQGEFVMLGALTMVSLTMVGIGQVPAFFLSILIVILIGFLVERLTIYPARDSSTVTQILITIGVGISLRGLALLFWGTNPYRLAPFTIRPPFRLFGAILLPQAIWIFAVGLLTMVLLYFLFEYTYLGVAIRACAVNRLAAKLVGITPEMVSLLSFGIAAALGAIAGIVITPITLATYDMGLMLGLKGFVAAVFGGFISAPGAIIGGLFIGIMESLGAGFISPGYKDVIVFMALLGILYFKPGGIFGRVEQSQV